MRKAPSIESSSDAKQLLKSAPIACSSGVQTMPSATKITNYTIHPVITINQHDMLEAAINLMIERSISCLPVVDRLGQLVGILTEGDILRCITSNVSAKPSHWLSFLLGSATTSRRVGRKVRDVMTRSVISAPTNTTPESIIDLMRHNRIQHVPIVEHGRLVGLISLPAFQDELANVAVSPETSADDRTVAPERWARLNAMHIPINGNSGIRVRDDTSQLSSMVNQSIGLPINVQQVS